MSEDTILLAGGGIAGLTAALALQRRGRRVVVLEQTARIGNVGAGITLRETASRSLYSLGLKDRLDATSDKPRPGAALDYRTGAPLAGSLGQRNWVATDFADVHMLHRADLFRLLKDAIDAHDPHAVQLDSRVTAFTQDDEGVTVTLADGRSLRGAALIGCDGLRSAVRGLLFGEAAPRRTGIVAYRFLVPLEQARPYAKALGMSVGPRASLSRYLIQQGTVVNCVAFAHGVDITEEGWNRHATRAELLDLFAGWHEDVIGLASCAPLETTACWALYDRDPLQTWVRGRVGLLGDAAHPVLPFLGFGAALGIEDAIVLARAFEAKVDPAEALKTYEAARRDRANAILLESRRQGEIFRAGPDGASDIPPHERESRAPYDPLTAAL
ncbi:MAG: FAD-dependent monooxygenase [Azospirillaceae bacterium]|nr:FAD-dependent monooxygenase [Azospirillaceae bacterium]